jgi:hypothetical protein
MLLRYRAATCRVGKDQQAHNIIVRNQRLKEKRADLGEPQTLQHRKRIKI